MAVLSHPSQRHAISRRGAGESFLDLGHEPTLQERVAQARSHLLIARTGTGLGLERSVVMREVRRAWSEIRIVRRNLERAYSARYRSRKARSKGGVREALRKILPSIARLDREIRLARIAVSHLD